MSSPSRRLIAFVGGLVTLFGGCEVLVRIGEPVVTAASHRTLTKYALLERHGPTDVIFIGTSRTNDGVSPRLFSDELSALRPALANVRGFNLSSASSSMEVLEWLTDRVAARPGLKLAVLELSGPQLQSIPLQFDAAPTHEDGIEGDIEAWVGTHSRLVAHRGILFSDNITRLPGLIVFAPALDGSEVMVTDQLRTWLGKPERGAAEADLSAWTITGDTRVASTEGAPPKDRLGRLVAVAKKYQAHGVRVVFEVPPLAQRYTDAPERTAAMRSFFRQVADATGAEVWDWSGARLPDDFFRGESHLSHAGRERYSRVLARKVIERGLLDGRAG